MALFVESSVLLARALVCVRVIVLMFVSEVMKTSFTFTLILVLNTLIAVWVLYNGSVEGAVLITLWLIGFLLERILQAFCQLYDKLHEIKNELINLRCDMREYNDK